MLGGKALTQLMTAFGNLVGLNEDEMISSQMEKAAHEEEQTETLRQHSESVNKMQKDRDKIVGEMKRRSKIEKNKKTRESVIRKSVPRDSEGQEEQEISLHDQQIHEMYRQDMEDAQFVINRLKDLKLIFSTREYVASQILIRNITGGGSTASSFVDAVLAAAKQFREQQDKDDAKAGRSFRIRKGGFLHGVGKKAKKMAELYHDE
tara:strand:+ start:459 stop:1076 length:618 start_codon:yes stop_codon:yes gene_type:complete